MRRETTRYGEQALFVVVVLLLGWMLLQLAAPLPPHAQQECSRWVGPQRMQQGNVLPARLLAHAIA